MQVWAGWWKLRYWLTEPQVSAGCSGCVAALHAAAVWTLVLSPLVGCIGFLSSFAPGVHDVPLHQGFDAFLVAGQC